MLNSHASETKSVIKNVFIHEFLRAFLPIRSKERRDRYTKLLLCEKFQTARIADSINETVFDKNYLKASTTDAQLGDFRKRCYVNNSFHFA